MKRLCAWCGWELEQIRPSETDKETHGICAECGPKYFHCEEEKKDAARAVFTDESPEGPTADGFG